ncbi:MAG: sigma-54 dependent transcriptional regulator [Deltaproteobacteria bacterium]|jgi:two-component system response regulator AtoC|nr:sigma-54 dependent transcriptional regulator [Deltaproteobacteria bacterium]
MKIIQKIFILDDEETITQSLRAILNHENTKADSAFQFEITTSSDSCTALQTLKDKNDFDLLLIDLKMPQIDGLTFLRYLQKSEFKGAIIAMSASGISDLALEAIRLGAVDFITKPFSPEELLFILKKNRRHLNFKDTNPQVQQQPKSNFSEIISQDPKILEIFEVITKISNFNTTVLITGESGTGKELIAKAIHQNSSRKDHKFIAINCGAIPETLLESELFGYKKGSFTDAKSDKKGLFEEANNGTIFLDEIGDLPFLLQVKLLRVLQERVITPIGSSEQIPIDVRIITATLKDLEEEVQKGNFREDLLYRLNVINIKVPALRERRGDINLLLDYFLEKQAIKFKIARPTLEATARQALINYNWQGNIRELENCLEQAMILKTGNIITVKDLSNKILTQQNSQYIPLTQQIIVENSKNLSIKQHTTDIEKALILKALEQTKGNRTQAAKLLEISHRALLYKIKEYGLS